MTKRLAPGVTLTQEIDTTTPLIINVVTVDLKTAGVHPEVAIGQDKIFGSDATKGREDVARLARRHKALVAVNGDYFDYTGDPLGLGIRNGELLSEPWTGYGKGGPRAVLGFTDDGKRALFDILGFLGDLQAADGQRIAVRGINRLAGKSEVVVYSSTYGDATANKPGGTDLVLTGVNLPLRANKMIQGKVTVVKALSDGITPIPPDGLVIAGGPGVGADFLAQHIHAGDNVGFVLGVGDPSNVASSVQVANLPRVGDLPSRAGVGIDRKAFLWSRMSHAIGGGPRLLVNGQVSVDGVAEGFDATLTDGPHPRTAVGTSSDGSRLYIVTVDGRQTISKGVSLVALAGILKRYGASEAINLDGGGSTTMAVGGITISSPGGTGYERPVADMLLIDSDAPYVETAPEDSVLPVMQVDPANVVGMPPAAFVRGPQIVAASDTLTVGAATTLTLVDGARTIRGDSGDVVWQGPSSGGCGFVNQSGSFLALAPGDTKITALYKGQLVTTTITVSAPAAPLVSAADLFALRTKIARAPVAGAQQSVLSVQIANAALKPGQGMPVHVSVTGGKADHIDGVTDADGGVTFRITWDNAAGGLVTVTSGTLASVTIGRPK
ncbi:phosphodiester glycosidase family protein [Capsulimonas corticalis]|uniref:phosphodiester glycosidase family protein n=1 Tax=Capsulimonas corticalis TaxID=2219043 RepID=UPI000FF971BC|nr:phosphodiester glycosidase family protein [Capsulimonas corticalis]